MVALILFGILAILVGGVLVRAISSTAENLSDPETGGLMFSACLFIYWLYWVGSNKPIAQSWENAIAIGPYFYIYTVVSLTIAFVSFRNFRRRRLDDLKKQGIDNINPDWKQACWMIGIIVTVFVVASAVKLQEQKAERVAAAALATERAATAALVNQKPEPKNVAPPPYLRRNLARSTEPKTELRNIKAKSRSKENVYDGWRRLEPNPDIGRLRMAILNESSDLVQKLYYAIQNSIIAAGNSGRISRAPQVLRDITSLVEVLEASDYIYAIPDKDQHVAKYKPIIAHLKSKMNVR